MPEVLVDGDQGLALHLVVVVPQVGLAGGVVHDAAGGQLAGVSDAQAAADEDHGDQPPGGAAPAVQVRGILGLGDHVLGERPREPFPPLGVVLGEEHGVRGQVAGPAVLADSGEQAVQVLDVLGVELPAAELGVQVGQVAFQQRAVHAGDAGDVHGRAGQVCREAADYPGAPGRDARAQAGGQPPPCPPLGQFLQPGLGDAAEAHVRDRILDAEVAQPPRVAGVFNVPAAAVGQVLDLPASVDDQRPGRGRGGPGRAGRQLARPPLLLGPVQQRYGAGAGGEVHHPLGLHGVHLDLPGVAAGLERVLPFQAQLGAQHPQVDAVTVELGLVVVAVGELPGVWPAVPEPPRGVGLAEHGVRTGPQVAVGDQAGDRRPGLQDTLPGGQPGIKTGLAGTAVTPGVTRAKAQAGPAVAAAGHPAGQRWGPPPPLRVSGGDKVLKVRFSLAPLLVMPAAQTPVPPGPAALIYQAQGAAEDRVLRVESQDLAPEPGPDCGHQPGQQPGRTGIRLTTIVSAGRNSSRLVIAGAHRPSPSSPKTVAVSLTITWWRRAAACSQVVPPPIWCPRCSSSASACRQAPNTSRTRAAGARPLTWPASTDPAGPTVQVMTGRSGWASRIAASSAAARRCHSARSPWPIHVPVTRSPRFRQR